MHTPLQSFWPRGHVQLPAWHVRPASQSPLVQQLAFETQVPLQSLESPPVQLQLRDDEQVPPKPQSPFTQHCPPSRRWQVPAHKVSPVAQAQLPA